MLIIQNADIWGHPYSTSVAVGDIAQFNCIGDGSYLYWYIDGINTEDMSSEEIADRGISFSGFYNYYPPYQDCYFQYSYLTMAGNCLNNNSQIHCVVLGYYPPPDGGNATSNTVTLTVEGKVLSVQILQAPEFSIYTGDPTDISSIQVTQTSANQLLVYWQLMSVSSQNYTQSINIATNGITTYSSVLDKLALYHLYIIDTQDPCVEYNITISVAIDNITCSDSITTSSYLKGKYHCRSGDLCLLTNIDVLFILDTGMPLQIKDTKQNHENKELIQFQAVSDLH